MAKWNPKAETTIQEIRPGLHIIANQSSKTRIRVSYLLQRQNGNVLFHGPDRTEIYRQLEERLSSLNGVKHHLLTHAPEASSSMAALESSFGTVLHINEHEIPFAERVLSRLDVHPFSNDSTVLPGINSCWLPGHTPGFSAFRVTHNRVSYLIMGDIVSEVKSGWKPRIQHALLKEGLESIEKLKTINAKYYLPNQAQVDLSYPPIDSNVVLEDL